MTRRRGVILPAGLALMIGLWACASRPPIFGGTRALRLSEVSSAGDPTRRASLRLCAEGLEADAAGRSAAAQSQYERAIQVDPTNPYAYLTLARYEVEHGDPRRALEVLDQAETLLESQGANTPGAETQVLGLRGAALSESGFDGTGLLSQARARDPVVWSDGQLSAEELE